MRAQPGGQHDLGVNCTRRPSSQLAGANINQYLSCLLSHWPRRVDEIALPAIHPSACRYVLKISKCSESMFTAMLWLPGIASMPRIAAMSTPMGCRVSL